MLELLPGPDFRACDSGARDGHNVLHWAAHGMALSAISDLEPAGVEEFARDGQRAP
ncbi:MAG TPA: hypothetical protein VHV80_03080 [Steroidobacteraceae bacterium]|nr:hypothetical protein [Steroidobacteraceae bacterium]